MEMRVQLHKQADLSREEQCPVLSGKSLVGSPQFLPGRSGEQKATTLLTELACLVSLFNAIVVPFCARMSFNLMSALPCLSDRLSNNTGLSSKTLHLTWNFTALIGREMWSYINLKERQTLCLSESSVTYMYLGLKQIKERINAIMWGILHKNYLYLVISDVSSDDNEWWGTWWWWWWWWIRKWKRWLW